MRALLLIYFAATAEALSVSDPGSQKKKSFSLFSVVQFDNEECQTNILPPGTVQGMCLTETECTGGGGVPSGNCASGFGVCCFRKFDETNCGSTINRNISYIENAVFPTPIRTANLNCQFSIAATSNLCQIRLDFATVAIGQPSTAAGSVGLCDGDSITVTSPGGYFITPLCGTLSGTHMYVETARNNQLGATVTIQTSAADDIDRSWRIRVINLECENAWKAPTDCLQYLTGMSNSLRSFNFGDTMIRNLQYDVCIRPEKGMCQFEVRQSSTTTDSFKMGSSADAVPNAFTAGAAENGGMGVVDGSDVMIPGCPQQFITVESHAHLGGVGDGGSQGSSRFCGDELNSNNGNTDSGVLIGDGPRMKVGVFSSGEEDATTGTLGFDLIYTQIACA